jgi:hypothetical protein
LKFLPRTGFHVSSDAYKLDTVAEEKRFSLLVQRMDNFSLFIAYRLATDTGATRRLPQFLGVPQQAFYEALALFSNQLSAIKRGWNSNI